MFINHFKDLIWSAAYVAIQYISVFAVHFHYSDIFTYHFFNGLLAFNNLYAIQVYETVITELYLATILTVFSILPLIWFHFICYLVSGFYRHEFLRFNRTYAKVLTIFLFESTLCLFIFLPHALGRGVFKGHTVAKIGATVGALDAGAGGADEGRPLVYGGEEKVFDFLPPHPGNPLGFPGWPHLAGPPSSPGVIQIYSYANVANLTARLIIIWVILAIILRTTTWQRRYLPLIIFIMSVWVTPPDIYIQGGLTLALFIYLEGHVWIRLWKARLKRAREGGFPGSGAPHTQRPTTAAGRACGALLAARSPVLPSNP